MNTDRADKKDTYWSSFLDLHPKNENFFNGSGFTGFKQFIIMTIKKLLMGSSII